MIKRCGIHMRWFTIALSLFFILSMHFRVGADELSEPKPPYSVEQLRKWHRSVEPWPWLGHPEQKVNLRNDKSYELLLAISGYARGGTFVLFAKVNDKWLKISDEIEQSHHPLHILNTYKDGWHDFQSFVPAWGSGGAEVWVFTYSWNGVKYILKNQKAGEWCDYEPFKNDSQLCPVR
jgi:hypothetical protein